MEKRVNKKRRNQGKNKKEKTGKTYRQQFFL